MNITRNKLNVIKSLENWRWTQEEKEYSFESSFYCFKDNINEDEKFAEKILLTHYLLYICDRQMDYRHIFKAGGYVVSHLVEEYIRQRKSKNYNWNEIFKICTIKKDSDNSYFLCAPIENNIKSEIFKYFLDRDKIINNDGYIITRNSNGEIIKKCIKNNKNNKYEFLFESNSDLYAIFSSRYILQDIGCMYKTLYYLNDKTLKYFNEDKEGKSEKIQFTRHIFDSKYNGFFSEFLKLNSDHICEYDNPEKGNGEITRIKESKCLANAMFELTYQSIPKITTKDINNDDIINSLSKKLVEKINETSKDYSLEKNRHSLKRMWCIIRDFIRHPVFRKCYQLIIGTEKFRNLCEKEQGRIELPGDVWNNNSTFAKCFWKNGEEAIKSSGFIRKMYDNRHKDGNDWGDCLPIDFDITFNFVPRMCEEDKCDICPLAKYSEDKDKEKYINWQEKICQESNKGKLCPLALYACGIKHKCDENCFINN